ncbi:MAG: 7-carboxy-7-deazaguanine synthase [Candidatus Kentron sp. G]|nr:MAG: 7-carboxy-7-deazaguanine synthase [Candidatus Kentron sp. G]VFM97060.1 MAG: 7-carboxy-7-deazaguanine synthase [Candidatus Kentron sp. G]
MFVRLAGCPLRCRYCDTRYAFYSGHRMSLAKILTTVCSYQRSSCDKSPPAKEKVALCNGAAAHSVFRAHSPFVTVTGGEPLAQSFCRELLGCLCDAGYQVSLETCGALDVAGVDERVSIVMDIKTPGSGEVQRNRYGNLAALSAKDQVKFVICDRQDYEWARARLDEWDIGSRCEVLFLPVQVRECTTQSVVDGAPGGKPMIETLLPGTLADWILADRLPVRMQIQLHKYLWGDVAGR